MDTELLRPVLTAPDAVEHFATNYICPSVLAKKYPELRKVMIGDCPDYSRSARDLFNECIYGELSKIGYLDFPDFVANRYKVRVLSANGIRVIDDRDDDEILSLLKNLGEEKVLKTLSNEIFMYGEITFSGEV